MLTPSSKSALERFFRRLALRSNLSAQEQAVLVELPGRMIQTKRGQELVIPGKIVNHATLVVDGVVGRYDQMADGQRQITALHIPGDMADLHSVPMPRPAWGVEALSTGAVLSVPHTELRRLVDVYPAIGVAFWRDTVVDASLLAKGAANLGRADASTRLAHLLCEMGCRFEAIGLGSTSRFQLPLTQSHLADALGLTTVHVNRTLGLLKQRCGLMFVDGEVVIEDWEALAAIASFDPSYLLL